MPADPVTVVDTAEFRRWFADLRDGRARGRILLRIRRLSLGNFGDTRSLGGGLHELRVDYGPGYRIYFVLRGDDLVLLVSGGDKSRQRNDIERARRIAAAWEADDEI
ncbi:MAG TPA: type II toxin-antitoxin system RelE/ParE family toxin [Allosphingosinicella sp.]|jgi:putative addiction module killer protein